MKADYRWCMHSDLPWYGRREGFCFVIINKCDRNMFNLDVFYTGESEGDGKNLCTWVYWHMLVLKWTYNVIWICKIIIKFYILINY